MRRVVPIIAAATIAFAGGWYLGHTRPSLHNQRKILADYESLRGHLGYTDAEMRQATEEFPKPSEFLASLANEDEMLASLAVGLLRMFDEGNPEAAKQRLLDMLGTYYRVHRTSPSYAKIISTIERAASESPSIAAEISKAAE